MEVGVFSKQNHNLLIFLNHKITDLIIGRQLNAESVGYYSVGYEISNLPTTELVFPLSRAIFPGYALIEGDLNALKNTFLKFTKLVVYVAAPVSFGIAAVSEELVITALGDKWVEVIPIISILSF